MTATTRRRTTLVGVLGLALLLLVAGPAAAQQPSPYGDDPSYALSCSPEAVAPGGTVTCEVVGAAPGEVLSWAASCSPPFAEGSEIADDEGRASFQFTVPDSCTGPITVEVLGSVSFAVQGALDFDIQLLDAVEEPEEEVVDDDDELPQTGADTYLAIAGGLLLIGLGGAAVLGARRRDRGRVGV